MDNKELQKTVNPVYLTAKSTLGLLKKAGDPDAVALLPIIGLETELQEKAKVFHIQPEVEKIFKMTGFDKILLLEYNRQTLY